VAWFPANSVVLVVVVASFYIHDGVVCFLFEDTVYFLFSQEAVMVKADGRGIRGCGQFDFSLSKFRCSAPIG
jgi:hypothetical protein